MKTTIYSLKDFRNEVMLIAKSVNKIYVAVEVRISGRDENNIEFKCYIDDYNWHTGKTMEEALTKLNEQVHPPVASTNSNIDVEIDVENAEVTDPANDVLMDNKTYE